MRPSHANIMIIFAFLALFASGIAEAKNESDDIVGVSFLESVLEKEKAVEGERLIYEVRLFTSDPDVAGAEVLENPDFAGLPATRVASDNRLQETVKDGKKLFTAVIDRVFLGTNASGKFNIKGGKYRIGYNRTAVVEDPFWGPARINRIEVEEMTAPDAGLKVSPLPDKGRPENFSGAIGDFEISISLPKGEIRAGENSLAIITISGKGDLTDIPAPDVMQGFREEGLHFRSMTDSKTHFISQGSLGSEMELDCIFSADSPGKYTIQPISFSYYDSNQGKYKTISTDAFEIEVGESAEPSRKKPPVVMEI